LPLPKRGTAACVGKFTKEDPLWMNYHWRVFRAKSLTARLTVTDWKDQLQPGEWHWHDASGTRVGQELVINFLELQPYLGKDD